MRDTFYKRSLTNALLFCLVLILGSCSQPTRESAPDEQVAFYTLEQIPAVLEKAQNSESLDERDKLRLDAAASLIALNEQDWARNILQGMFPAALNDAHYLRFNMLSAELALAEGRPFRAKRYLWDDRFTSLVNKADLDTQIVAGEARAGLLYDLAEYRQSIQERILLEALLLEDPERQAQNQDALWQSLMELSVHDLALESEQQRDPTIRGWYTLAALAKNNQTNIRLQLQEVENWTRQWPEHPASLRLPADLQFLKQLVEQQATEVAVLLPLSGKLENAAKAIRDGMMAAWYNASELGDSVPNLRFYDTGSGDINQVYDTALAEGAQLVIGPLDKSQIAELALRPELEVPTLGLNHLEGDMPLANNLFQFGLAPEDDARQVAQRAWRDGHRRALILAPPNEWGDRGVHAFSEEWLALGGELTQDYRYAQTRKFSSLIADAFDVSDSNQRRRHVRSVLGQINLEFQPRRREDVDFVFLIAHPDNARLLKPALNFHYAGDVPVYATSHVYNGEVDPGRDKDMNEIRFVSLPWYFDSRSPEKRAIDNFARKGAAYQRLYAFGVDAYHLFPRLQQLQRVTQAQFYGATGNLSIDEQRRVVRQQYWAQFVQGRATAMPSATLEADES